MMKQEQNLWASMSRNQPADFWLQRVENVMVTGMPDIYSVRNGRAAWIELKAVSSPVKDTTTLLGRKGLNVDQINWHIRAAAHGVRSFILIRTIGKRELRLLSGASAKLVNHMSYGEFKSMPVTTWDEVFEALR